MFRQRKQSSQRAQSLMEYSLILGVIVIIIITMNPLLKRSTQAMIKLAADQIGNQQNADQTFDDSGHLDSSIVNTNTLSITFTRENAGIMTHNYDETTTTRSSQVVNLGFRESSD